MVKGVFFDVGGTLCKSSAKGHNAPSFKGILAASTGRSVSDFNVRNQPYLWTSCAPKETLIRHLCQELQIADWETILRRLDSSIEHVVLYDDVKPCLSRLSGLRLGLLSNTTVWTAHDHIELGLGEFLQCSVLSCMVGAAKSDQQIFARAEEKIGLSPKHLVYVGDSLEYDVLPAIGAGWKAVLLRREGSILKSPVPVISSLRSLTTEMLERI